MLGRNINKIHYRSTNVSDSLKIMSCKRGNFWGSSLFFNFMDTIYVQPRLSLLSSLLPQMFNYNSRPKMKISKVSKNVVSHVK